MNDLATAIATELELLELRRTDLQTELVTIDEKCEQLLAFRASYNGGPSALPSSVPALPAKPAAPKPAKRGPSALTKPKPRKRGKTLATDKLTIMKRLEDGDGGSRVSVPSLVSAGVASDPMVRQALADLEQAGEIKQTGSKGRKKIYAKVANPKPAATPTGGASERKAHAANGQQSATLEGRVFATICHRHLMASAIATELDEATDDVLAVLAKLESEGDAIYEHGVWKGRP